TTVIDVASEPQEQPPARETADWQHSKTDPHLHAAPRRVARRPLRPASPGPCGDTERSSRPRATVSSSASVTTPLKGLRDVSAKMMWACPTWGNRPLASLLPVPALTPAFRA